MELSLMAGVWVSQPQFHEYKRTDLSTLMTWGIIGTEMPPVPCPLLAVGDAAHTIMRTGKLALLLTSCSPGEGGPHLLP